MGSRKKALRRLLSAVSIVLLLAGGPGAPIAAAFSSFSTSGCSHAGSACCRGGACCRKTAHASRLACARSAKPAPGCRMESCDDGASEHAAASADRFVPPILDHASPLATSEPIVRSAWAFHPDRALTPAHPPPQA